MSLKLLVSARLTLPQLTCVGPSSSGPWKRQLYMGCQDRGVVIGPGNGDGLEPSQTLIPLPQHSSHLRANTWVLDDWLQRLIKYDVYTHHFLKLCVGILALSLLQTAGCSPNLSQIVPSHNSSTLLKRHHNQGNFYIANAIANAMTLYILSCWPGSLQGNQRLTYIIGPDRHYTTAATAILHMV